MNCVVGEFKCSYQELTSIQLNTGVCLKSSFHRDGLTVVGQQKSSSIGGTVAIVQRMPGLASNWDGKNMWSVHWNLGLGQQGTKS